MSLIYNTKDRCIVLNEEYLRKLISKTSVGISLEQGTLDNNLMYKKIGIERPFYTIDDFITFISEKLKYSYKLDELLTLDYPTLLAICYLLVSSKITQKDIELLLDMSSISAREELVLNWLVEDSDDILYGFFSNTSINAEKKREDDYISKTLATQYDAKISSTVSNIFLNKQSNNDSNEVECKKFNAAKNDNTIPYLNNINWHFDRTNIMHLDPTVDTKVFDVWSNTTFYTDISKETKTKTTVTFKETVTTITSDHYDEIYEEYQRNKAKYIADKLESIAIDNQSGNVTYTYYDSFHFDNSKLLKYYLHKYSFLYLDEYENEEENMLEDLYDICFSENLLEEYEGRSYSVDANLCKDIKLIDIYNILTYMRNTDSEDETEIAFDEFFDDYYHSDENITNNNYFVNIDSKYQNIDNRIFKNDEYSLIYNFEDEEAVADEMITHYVNRIDYILTSFVADISKNESITNHTLAKNIMSFNFELGIDSNGPYISNFGLDFDLNDFKNALYTDLKDYDIQYNSYDYLDFTKRTADYYSMFNAKYTNIQKKITEYIGTYDIPQALYYLSTYVAYRFYVNYIFNEQVPYEPDLKYYVTQEIYELYRRVKLIKGMLVHFAKAEQALLATVKDMSRDSAMATITSTPPQIKKSYSYDFVLNKVTSRLWLDYYMPYKTFGFEPVLGDLPAIRKISNTPKIINPAPIAKSTNYLASKTLYANNKVRDLIEARDNSIARLH